MSNDHASASNAKVPAAHLTARNVSLVYETSHGSLKALDDLNLEVASGEFVSVLGPSGCGKSSLLKLVTGLLAPTEGEITLAGSPVRDPRGDVGIVFQRPTLLPWRTVFDNVLVPIRARGRPTAAQRESALLLLKMTGLEQFARHYPHELSGGMQQRVGIARGLVHEPELLLMDEPFAALDAMTREFMLDELQRIWLANRKSVLFITHSIPEAVFLSDRVLVMGPRPGRVIETVKVDIPRPRSVNTMAEPIFNDMCAHLRNVFRTFGEGKAA